MFMLLPIVLLQLLQTHLCNWLKGSKFISPVLIRRIFCLFWNFALCSPLSFLPPFFFFYFVKKKKKKLKTEMT